MAECPNCCPCCMKADELERAGAEMAESIPPLVESVERLTSDNRKLLARIAELEAENQRIETARHSEALYAEKQVAIVAKLQADLAEVKRITTEERTPPTPTEDEYHSVPSEFWQGYESGWTEALKYIDAALRAEASKAGDGS